VAEGSRGSKGNGSVVWGSGVDGSGGMVCVGEEVHRDSCKTASLDKVMVGVRYYREIGCKRRWARVSESIGGE
jgi:hypothetical protein